MHQNPISSICGSEIGCDEWFGISRMKFHGNEFEHYFCLPTDAPESRKPGNWDE